MAIIPYWLWLQVPVVNPLIVRPIFDVCLFLETQVVCEIIPVVVSRVRRPVVQVILAVAVLLPVLIVPGFLVRPSSNILQGIL